MKTIVKFTIIAALLFSANLTFGQLLVDAKNVTDDAEIQYIQVMYYLDQKSFKPVYMIDYGMIDSGTGPAKNQKIVLNKEEITDSMSPALVMNRLSKAGWEYMGDATYIKVPLMENLVTYTFRRKPK